MRSSCKPFSLAPAETRPKKEVILRAPLCRNSLLKTLVVGTILYTLELFLFEKASFSQSIRSSVSTAFRLGVSHCSFGEIALELHHPGKLLFSPIQGVDTRFKQSKNYGSFNQMDFKVCLHAPVRAPEALQCGISADPAGPPAHGVLSPLPYVRPSWSL